MTFSTSTAMALRSGEFGVVEDGAEEALGQEMLDEHLVDLRLADARIKRRLNNSWNLSKAATNRLFPCRSRAMISTPLAPNRGYAL